MSASEEWLTSGTGLAPKITWSFAVDAELQSLAMARETGEIVVIDRAGGVYRLSRAGKVMSVNRGLRSPRIVRWSDRGDVGVIIERHEHITIVNAELKVAWTAAAPATIVAADIDAYGHIVVIALDNNQTVVMSVDRQKLAEFDTIRPLKFLTLSVGTPQIVGAAEHGLLCSYSLDGEERWSERLWTSVGDLSVAGDAKRIFVAEFGHGLHSLDGRGKNQSAYVLEGAPSRVSSSFFGERVAAATLERQIYWLDADGTLLWAAECPDEIAALICDPLGEWLLVGFKSGRIVRLDWEL